MIRVPSCLAIILTLCAPSGRSLIEHVAENAEPLMLMLNPQSVALGPVLKGDAPVRTLNADPKHQRPSHALDESH